MSNNNNQHFGFGVGSEIPLSKIYKKAKGGLDNLVRSRFFVAIILVNVIFIVLVISIFSTLQFFKKDIVFEQTSNMIRGNILDRNGEILATNLETKNLYANPKKILDAVETSNGLVKVFPSLNYDEVYKKLTDPKKTFVYIQKKLTPQEVYLVKLVGDPGLNFEEYQARVYPMAKVFSHALGIIDSENNGVFGVEKIYNEKLKGRPDPLTVSLDSRIQNIMYKVLYAGMEKYEALGASALLMDPNTGEVLAMMSLPSFDPKDIGAYDENAKFNKITQGVYELGSIFKVMNTASAIEFGIPETKKFEVWKPIKIGRFTITDVHRMKEQYATMGDILSKSSNIGSVHMVYEMGIDFQKNFLTKMNLLGPMQAVIKVASPIIPRKWTKASSASVSYGYNISMAPFQYLTALNAVINGGFYIYPRFDIAELGKPLNGHQVYSMENSIKMRKLMAGVMEDGTGFYSRVRGINIGGKTGTANKLINGEYVKNKVTTAFVAVFPIENPRYTMFVMFDEPKEKAGVYGRTAGANAAPISKEIIESIYHLLDLE